MEIVNGTNQDTRVKVTSGGAGISSYDSYLEEDDPSKWPLLPAGAFIDYSPLSPPCTVCFVVNGRQVLKEVKHAASKVTLAPVGSTFKVDIE